MCGVTEDVDHILFRCVISSFVWSAYKEALGWDRIPTSMADFLNCWIPLGCRDYQLKLFFFGVTTWALWVTRNKMMIEGKFPRSPIDALSKIDVFMQRWRILLRAEERGKLGNTKESMVRWLEIFVSKSNQRENVEAFI